MKKITVKEVKKIAALARLGIRDEEASAATEKLEAILENFSAIQKIDTTDVPPADDVTGLRNVAAADEAKPEALCSHDALLAAAPATHGRQLKVPAVF